MNLCCVIAAPFKNLIVAVCSATGQLLGNFLIFLLGSFDVLDHNSGFPYKQICHLARITKIAESMPSKLNVLLS